MLRFHRAVGLCLATLACAASVLAQDVRQDPTARLREVLPADVAERVLATIADARAHALPADALAQRALKFAAKGVAPADIERAVAEQSARLAQSKRALDAGTHAATPDEIEAGAEAMRQGIDGGAVSALARTAPSGRALAVPLYVMGALRQRGLPSADALARVERMLAARASDADLETLPASASPDDGRAPAAVGRDVSAARHPGGHGAAGAPGGGPPAGVPANAGGGSHGGRPGRPGHP